MRYIRTKDNRIIDTTKYYIEGSNLFKNGAYQEYQKELANAYKKADNIEELFDEYVLVDKVYSVNPDVKDKMLRKCFGKEAFKKELIYGAIWCKGENDKPILKSVARMIDENGGWELI